MSMAAIEGICTEMQDRDSNGELDRHSYDVLSSYAERIVVECRKNDDAAYRALKQVCRMCAEAEEGTKGYEVNFCEGNCDCCFIGRALRGEGKGTEVRHER